MVNLLDGESAFAAIMTFLASFAQFYAMRGLGIIGLNVWFSRRQESNLLLLSFVDRGRLFVPPDRRLGDFLGGNGRENWRFCRRSLKKGSSKIGI